MPTDNLIAIPEKPNLLESWANALTKRPDIQRVALELQRQNIVVKFNYNQLFPSLDFAGAIGVRSGTNDFDAGITDIRDMNHPFYSVGVILTIPFSNKGPRNAYRASQALKERTVTQLTQLQNTVLAKVDTAVKIVSSSYQRIASTRSAREYADAALVAEQRLLAAGGTTSFFVVERQAAATAARSKEILALADYNKAVAQLAYEEGITLEKNLISLQIK